MADPVFRSAYDFLAPSPDANYGSVLPFAYNREGSPSWVTEGSNQRLAMPEWLRSAAQGVVGLGESTQTGQLTPEALALLTTGSVGTGALFAPRGALAAGASRPIQAWHGSPTPGIAPGELVPSARGPLGPAVYMSPNENVAQRYAGQGGHLYERTVNPDDIFHGMRIHGQTDVNPYEVWRNQQKKLVEAAEPDKKEAINALFEKTWPDDGYSMFWELSRLYGSQEKAQEALKSAGFKGYSANIDGPEIAWFGKYGVAGGPPVPGLNVAPQQQQPSQAPGFRVAKDMVY